MKSRLQPRQDSVGAATVRPHLTSEWLSQRHWPPRFPHIKAIPIVLKVSLYSIGQGLVKLSSSTEKPLLAPSPK